MSNKDLKFTEAKWTPETDVDKIKPLNIEDIAKSIADARNNAIINAISANAIIINKKYAKTSGFYYNDGFGRYVIPPMFMGLYVEFKELPKEFAFALAQLPKPYIEELIANAREEGRKIALGEVVEWFLNEVEEDETKLFNQFIKRFELDEENENES